MLEKLLNEYFPATLTFIVGMLGILSQLTINFFSELNKYNLELEKTKKEKPEIKYNGRDEDIEK